MCLSVCAHVLCCCLCAHAQGPDWANLDLQLADELHAISKQDREAGQGGVGGEGFGQGCELDRFVVEAPSAYLDTRFGALEESALVGEGGAKGQEDGEELAYPKLTDQVSLSLSRVLARARLLARPLFSLTTSVVLLWPIHVRVCARAHTHTRMCTQNRDHAALRYKRISYCARRGLGNPAGRCAISGASAFVRTFPHLCLHTCIRRQLSSHPQACVHVVHAHMRTCAHARTSICKRRYFANPSCSQRPIKHGAYKCIRAYQCIRLLPLPAQTGEHNEWRLAQSRQTLGTNWGVGSCRRQVVGRNVQQWHRGSRSWVSGESYVRVHVCCIYVCNRNMYVHTNLCMCA